MAEKKKRMVAEGSPCPDCRAHGTQSLRLDYAEGENEDLREALDKSKGDIWPAINKLNDEKVSFKNFKLFMTLIIGLLTIGAGLLVETRVAVVKELGEIRKELNGNNEQAMEKKTKSSTAIQEEKKKEGE